MPHCGRELSAKGGREVAATNRNPRPHVKPVIAMWGCTVCAWVAAGALGWVVAGTVLDAAATVTAMVLLILPAPIDKINGALKLLLQFSLLLFALISLSRQGIGAAQVLSTLKSMGL